MIYLCLRFLRCFEKWSELGKMGKNGVKSLSQNPQIYTTLILGNGKHTRRKRQEHVLRERKRWEKSIHLALSLEREKERDRWGKKYSSRIITILYMLKSKFSPE